jgi:hypothetical protein
MRAAMDGIVRGGLPSFEDMEAWEFTHIADTPGHGALFCC